MSAAEKKEWTGPDAAPEEVALRREFRVPVADAVKAWLHFEGRRQRAKLGDMSYSGAFLQIATAPLRLAEEEIVQVSFESRSKRRCRVPMVVRHLSEMGLGLELSRGADKDAVAALRGIVNEAQRDFIRTQLK